MHVHALYRYPVKSLGGQQLDQLEPREKGFADDRRWMFTDEDGVFITQRRHPQLAGYLAHCKGDQLTFQRIADNCVVETINAARGADGADTSARVRVWDDTFRATEILSPALAGITAELGIPGARLMYMADTDVRLVDPDYGADDETVSFADGFPYLITTTGSLESLSRELGDPQLDERRFRPNIIVYTDAPWLEDGWRTLRIGEHNFRLPKPCARCIMVTQKPGTGARSPEVLAALANLRRVDKKVLFGMNACWEVGSGPIRQGDPVSVVVEAE